MQTQGQDNPIVLLGSIAIIVQIYVNILINFTFRFFIAAKVCFFNVFLLKLLLSG